MKQNKFDLVMDYIDENIQQDTETIKNGIINLIGINSNSFGQYFTVLTGDTLGGYIRNRRLYFAAMELLRKPEKPICDIALDYGYSDQSAFTRAISGKFNMSPNEIRNSWEVNISNEKYLYSDFNPNSSNMRSDRIWTEFERTGYISSQNLNYLDEIQHGHEQFGFDMDTSYAIADLSERLDVPVCALMEVCFKLIAEVQSDPNYISDRAMTAMCIGLHSEEDLDEICEHYACKYYELNSYMVCEYFRTHGENV